MMRLLRGIVPSVILDVGAGSGFFSRHLLAQSGARAAWCVDTSYASDSDEYEAGKAVHNRRAVSTMDVDLVLLMDVLEHVDDDVALLKEYVGKVPIGSRFLLSVPAFQFLWSGHDVFLEHKRRYTLPQLEAVARNAGLRVTQGCYFFGAVFPIAASVRLTQRQVQGAAPQSQLRMHHPFVNALLGGLCAIELPFLRLNRAAGLTVFCVAEKV
jgi:SAM-dependent methyltransferase